MNPPAPTSDSSTASGESVSAIPVRYSRTLKIWLPGRSPATTASQISAYARPMISPRVVMTDSTRKIAVYRYDPTMLARANANVTSIAAELNPPISRPLTTVDGHDEDRGQRAGHERLDDDDLPALDGLREQVDAGPVLQLHPERGRPEDERDQRQHDPDHEAVDRRPEDLRAKLVLVGPDEQPEQHRHRREQDHQQGPAPAEQRPQGDRRERREDRHRRDTR